MALGRKEQKDWYKVLGAKPSDSPAELKRKYQKLALLYHPDKQAAGAAAEERTRQFLEIHQAWKVLGNEETKQEYDLQQRDFVHFSFHGCAQCWKNLGDQMATDLSEDNLTKEGPLHEQIYLEDMSWNEDEQLYTLSCRCGGNYSVSKSETQDVSLVCCDTCSLVIEILQ